jgi:hypothetical protein
MNSIIALIGRAGCWEQDLQGLFSLHNSIDVMAIGLDCSYLGKVNYFATYHIQDIPVYKNKREALGLNTDYKVISHIDENEKPVDILISYKRPSGSSAMLGAFAAILLGYQKIVLCGCPLTGTNEKNESYSTFRIGWEKHRDRLEDKVRSMSGWTAEFLGIPDKKWLEDIV